MEATIFISHGSRSEQGNNVFVSFIEKVIVHGKIENASYGFLEKASPTIFEAVETSILQGAEEVTVVPVLLLPGIHANVDIPAELERIKQKYPKVKVFYGDPLGVNETALEIVLDRLRNQGFSDSQSDTVLLVGHGSREPNAEREFAKLGSTLQGKIQSSVETSYITTYPFYGDQLMACRPSKKVFVVPYLLYSGGFIAKIEETVNKFRKANPANQFLLCKPFGFDERLVDLLIQRAEEARKGMD